MMQNTQRQMLFILLIIALAAWAVLPDNPGVRLAGVERQIHTRLGLDLVGGVQALLEADLPPETRVELESMRTARTIVENRVNGLGVSEAVVQLAGDRRIVVELPGETDPEKALDTIKQTGLLEFVDFGTAPLPPGAPIETDFGLDPAPAPSPDAPQPVWHTVMTGQALESAQVVVDQLGQYAVAFSLNDEGSRIFAEYTTQNVGRFLGIVLDKRVISAPQVQTPITDGQGQITGNFTAESANALAVQLRYGSLPIPLKVVESKTVGPTLGQDSLRKSLIAGIVGLGVVALFMALYYRLPGVLADLALAAYALIAFALFRLIPVTLTLPGIAGFVLSIGVAVDANILIFERLKEELRGGRNLRQAIDLGWERAWPSIRDSNISTLITCAILFWFGSAFGASIVKGFAVTLAIGVLVSLFTAIVVTRTFLHLTLDNVEFAKHPRWFGI